KLEAKGEYDAAAQTYRLSFKQSLKAHPKYPNLKAVPIPVALAYIISYRQHNGFHEQCVEQIFADIWQNLEPEKLMVYATYTR
uniref:DUF3458 domain-containing protein n=1 Tax=Acinetobacter oleivorans TaxID=1148157 RepID=UPI001D182E74